MNEAIRGLVWFGIAASIAAYASYLLAASFVEANAANTPVLIRDELGPNVHHLSGMVMVPASCYELSVRTEAVSDTVLGLVFTTWKEPSVDCSPDQVPRAFRAILFAPAVGVNFIATMDGAPLEIAVIPTRVPTSTSQ
ncbi:MAG: hypothetical protein U1D26_02155 [Patescibacteria group bacterium]|nr:hypothetical protein [bacterium]MDZ4227259.1 hypothetical protein [Patescibacteria group bacterium]